MSHDSALAAPHERALSVSMPSPAPVIPKHTSASTTAAGSRRRPKGPVPDLTLRIQLKAEYLKLQAQYFAAVQASPSPG